jgi:Protein  of unknown function (DUF3018)
MKHDDRSRRRRAVAEMRAIRLADLAAEAHRQLALVADSPQERRYQEWIDAVSAGVLDTE